MEDTVSRVMNATLAGGNQITPLSVSVAIRSALMECKDANGKIDIQCLYELTCDLERKQ